MIFPLIIHRQPATCPDCGNLESTRTLCNHCDYEYKNEEVWSWYGILMVGTVVLALSCLVIPIVDSSTGSHLYKYIFIEKDCEYNLPKYYQMKKKNGNYYITYKKKLWSSNTVSWSL